MIPILEELPEALMVDGCPYPIYTDFRHWMAFELLILDPDVGQEDRYRTMLEWFREQTPPDVEAAVRALLWFYLGGQTLEQMQEEARKDSGSTKSIYHFEKDAERIFASFASAAGYRMDLESVGHLHWWKFRAMLLHISPDTAMGRVMGLRATDDAELTEAQRRLKRLCDLERRPGGAPRTKAQRDEEMINRAREARRRAEAARDGK